MIADGAFERSASMGAFSRRKLLLSGGVLGGALLAACGTSSPRRTPAAGAARSLSLRKPGSRPYPHLPVGHDSIPEIKHVLVFMQENHSFDNVLGMLGRGDGLTRGSDGIPTNTNPGANRELVRSFPMPTPCQEIGKPVQTWNASHIQYDNGTNRGFVVSRSGSVAMGYLTADDLPFTYAMAKVFPIGDRYHCSVLGQTWPNRRYMMAGTSAGMVNDVAGQIAAVPPRGTILQVLTKLGISWRDYYQPPSQPTADMYLAQMGDPAVRANAVPIDQFFTDAKNGALPSFAIIDPEFGANSEENPQDVQYGDAQLAQVVHALFDSPNWPDTLLLWTYDEHGGYYDHVPPPPAPKPDDVAPDISVPPDRPGAFDRYGFRVPAAVVSPYAKADHVSNVVYDHTSILAYVERKWNLPAFTYRDANANDLSDFVDLRAKPAFLTPPNLPGPMNTATQAGCTATGPGAIPPVGAVTHRTPNSG
ncbi:MAG: alkaline phosphatase family protein [Acidimicrobiales bacterium]